MSDLTDFQDHARAMAKSFHRPECMLRPAPWLKPVPTPGCAGCVTPDDRALWERLAAEIDDYLNPSLDGDVLSLFDQES